MFSKVLLFVLCAFATNNSLVRSKTTMPPQSSQQISHIESETCQPTTCSWSKDYWHRMSFLLTLLKHVYGPVAYDVLKHLIHTFHGVYDPNANLSPINDAFTTLLNLRTGNLANKTLILRDDTRYGTETTISDNLVAALNGTTTGDNAMRQMIVTEYNATTAKTITSQGFIAVLSSILLSIRVTYSRESIQQLRDEFANGLCQGSADRLIELVGVVSDIGSAGVHFNGSMKLYESIKTGSILSGWVARNGNGTHSCG